MVSPASASLTSSLTQSGDKRIDALQGGYKWGGSTGSGATITYSFATAGSTWVSGYYSNEPNGPNYHGLSASEQLAVRRTLAAWSDVANITFAEVTETASNVGDIRIAYSGALPAGAYAWAYFPGAYAEAGDIWLNANYGWSFGTGSYSELAVMHELGHALGLKHPFEGAVRLSGAQNSRQYTIMSYTHYNGADGEPVTPMLYDVLAIQRMYGANMTTRSGDTVYTFTTHPNLQCIWDAGGSDTFDCSNQVTAVTLSLIAGSFSSIGTLSSGALARQNVAIAFGAIIENAIGGTANDSLTGNDVANLLNGGDGNDGLAGGGGNDTLDGGAGVDRMNGGRGDDTFLVDRPGDAVTEALNQGYDVVHASVSYTLGVNIEKLVLTGGGAINGIGNALGNLLIGNAAANTLNGLAGNDTIIGGDGADMLNGGTGADSLVGGAGNDLYVVDTPSDVIVEAANDGGDTILSYASWVLGPNQENLCLLLTTPIHGTGNADANVLVGNGGANRLNGLGGDDSLVGGNGADTLDGGAGGDVLAGGLGNDRFIFAAVTDSPVGTGHDNVVDFDGLDRVGDVIDVSAIDANASVPGNQAFIFIGVAAFDGATSLGKLHVLASGTDTLIQGDIDGDGTADFEILVQNTAAARWVSADFIL